MQPAMPLLEIAPDLFVKSWDDVSYASLRQYYRCDGTICRFFEIRLTNERNFVVGDFNDDIDRTIKFWKSHSIQFGNEPTNGTETAGKLHEDIDRWMNATPPGPKSIPRR
jgi:hypothetical protein